MKIYLALALVSTLCVPFSLGIESKPTCVLPFQKSKGGFKSDSEAKLAIEFHVRRLKAFKDAEKTSPSSDALAAESIRICQLLRDARDVLRYSFEEVNLGQAGALAEKRGWPLPNKGETADQYLGRILGRN